MKHLPLKLKQKGWSEEDIEKAQRSLQRGELKKSFSKKILDQTVYWIALFVVLIGNFLLLLSMIPLLLLSGGLYLTIPLILVGLCFGTISEYIICGITATQKKYHLFTALFFPIFSFINTVVVTLIANKFINIAIHVGPDVHKPLILGFIYMIAVFIPFIIHKTLYKSF